MAERVRRAATGAVALALTLGLACGSERGVEPGGPSGPEGPYQGWCAYMPLTVGNKWVYDYLDYASWGGREEGERTLEVTGVEENYYGFVSYTLELSREGARVTEYLLGCDGERCYLYRGAADGGWRFLIATSMPLGMKTGTGLLTEGEMEYRGEAEISVPAGRFAGCKELKRDVSGYGWYAEYREYYANEVGLVKFRRYYDEGKWYEIEYYELKSYDVQLPE